MYLFHLLIVCATPWRKEQVRYSLPCFLHIGAWQDKLTILTLFYTCVGFLQPWEQPYVCGTCQSLLKWKYPHMNSVDFLLEALPGAKPKLKINTQKGHQVQPSEWVHGRTLVGSWCLGVGLGGAVLWYGGLMQCPTLRAVYAGWDC